MMILALNINSLVKHLALGKEWVSRRMKAVRFGFIEVVGRFVRHARSTVLKLSGASETVKKIIEARAHIFLPRTTSARETGAFPPLGPTPRG